MDKANDEKDKKAAEEIKRAGQEIHKRIKKLAQTMDDKGNN